MPALLFRASWFARCCLTLLISFLAACSSTDTFEEPAPVPEIVTSVQMKEIWDMSIGDGHDDSFLYLEPLYTGDGIYAASADGEIYSLEPETGRVIWERDTDLSIMAGLGGDPNRLYLA